jgi:hypothetical protein
MAKKAKSATLAKKKSPVASKTAGVSKKAKAPAKASTGASGPKAKTSGKAPAKTPAKVPAKAAGGKSTKPAGKTVGPGATVKKEKVLPPRIAAAPEKTPKPVKGAVPKAVVKVEAVEPAQPAAVAPAKKAKPTKATPPTPTPTTMTSVAKAIEPEEEYKPEPEVAGSEVAGVEAPEEKSEKKKKKDDFKIDRSGNLETQWKLIFDKSKALKPVPYKMSDNYEARTAIMHKVLGWGYVLTSQNNRLEVLFKDGIKFLIANYKG